MSAEKKNRKRQQRTTGERYQHPTREGVPYGRSPQPRLTSLDIDEEQMRVMKTVNWGSIMGMTR